MRNDYNDHKQLDTHPEALNGGLVEGNVLVVRADHLPREGVLWGLLQLLQEAQQAGLQSLVRRLPLILVERLAVVIHSATVVLVVVGTPLR